MSTDLFGKPLAGYPRYTLSVHQKRQATLIHHWMSMNYLKELLAMINRLVAGADVLLDTATEQGRDAIMSDPLWGVRNTPSNWSTHVYPALEAFRESTIRLIARRSSESYSGTGANQCARMISEHSSMWMTREEEKRFEEEFRKVRRYAGWIDSVCGAGGGKYLDDSSFWDAWLKYGHLYPRLPLLRVRTDVEGESGKVPPRTGVYVAQDDPNATLQFGWTGNSDGQLGKAMTFNTLGLKALAAVGRNALWGEQSRIMQFVSDCFQRGEMTDRAGFFLGDEKDPEYAWAILAGQAFTSRPCKWYFVEMIDGAFDDADETESAETLERTRPNVPANQPCPEAGWWFTPAKANSRRYFKQGETMTAVGGDYGETFWQWSPDQSAPTL